MWANQGWEICVTSYAWRLLNRLTSTGNHWFPKPGWLHELVEQSDFGKIWSLTHGCSKAATENLIQSLLPWRANANLFPWRHLLIFSDRWFRRLCPLYLTISGFSLKNKEYLLVLGLYLCCFLSIFHAIFGVYVLLLMLHNSLEISVLLWCFQCLKDFIWFEYRCLNLVSVMP